MGYKRFFEPKSNKFLIKLTKFILPLALGSRVILTPNHPTPIDPIIMFYLSRVIDYNFNYLAAWDIFVEEPIKGYFIQQLGAYSIIRNSIDNNSLKKLLN
ncbi:MAG: hypothetical protein ACP5RD_04695 [bacterium]|jgi:hypothetical protein